MTWVKGQSGNPAGPQSRYRDEYCEEMVAFCAQGYSLTGYAGEIGVCRDTITLWRETHPDFAIAVKRAKAACARWWEERGRTVATEGGPGGQSSMVIFGLKNHAPDDYQDKQELKHSGTVTLAQMVEQSFGADAKDK